MRGTIKPAGESHLAGSKPTLAGFPSTAQYGRYCKEFQRIIKAADKSIRTKTRGTNYDSPSGSDCSKTQENAASAIRCFVDSLHTVSLMVAGRRVSARRIARRVGSANAEKMRSSSEDCSTIGLILSRATLACRCRLPNPRYSEWSPPQQEIYRAYLNGAVGLRKNETRYWFLRSNTLLSITCQALLTTNYSVE
jgi:hypothetical protein